MSPSGQEVGFESVKTRLAEIAEAVDDESLSLDDALDLYEEAVSLGLQASDLLETGIDVPEDNPDEQGGSGEGPAAGADGQRFSESSPAVPGSPETADSRA